MELKDKIIIGFVVILSFCALYTYFMETTYHSSISIYFLLLPLLFVCLFFAFQGIQNAALLNSGGSINIFNYYGLNPVYLQIFDDGKHVWDEYVDLNSVTQYQWVGLTTIRAVGSDNPSLGNPSTTIYFDLSYSVSGANNILIILNADSSYFEQLSVL